MPSVLDRSALEQSPLADLHLLANELGVDGFRRLRKPDLVDAILSRQSGDEAPSRRRRGGRGRGRRAPSAPMTMASPSARAAAGAAGAAAAATRTRAATSRDVDRDEPVAAAAARSRAAATSARSRARSSCSPTARASCGSRRRTRPTTTSTSPPRRSSAASSSPATASPARCAPARRSERFPSLIRVDTINGRPAEEVAEGTRFEDLPVAWPAERIAARQRGPDGQGDRVADAVRQGLARRDRRPVALGQVRGAAPAGRRAGVGAAGSRSPRS